MSAVRVALSSGTVAYHAAGDGAAVLLLHGFTQDSRIWRRQFEQLSEELRLIAWDAPGAGASDDPPDSFGIEDWASALDEFLSVIGVESAHLVGLSWGGLLAQEFYRRAPRRVTSLVLADTYAGWTGSLSADVAAERLVACERDSLLPPHEFVARYLPGMFSANVATETQAELARVMADTHPLGFRLMAAALAQADTRDILRMIAVPTLLIWGDADARSPLSVGRQMRQLVPQAELVVLRGAGHVSNLERASEFNSAVRKFIHHVETSA